MTKYKVGDVAALFSKPKSPTTTGGKKLQSLFEDYYGKKDKPTVHSQLAENKTNKSGKIAEVNDHSASKKSKKRKFSQTVDSEVDENISSKKFKESVEVKGFKNNENKNQKFKKQKDFPRKKKQSKGNSFNFNPTFPKIEFQNVSKNDVESPSAPKLKNSPIDNKQMKGFIKKSKKKSLDNNNSSKLSNDISSKDYNDSGDEDSLRKEIKEFMQNSSAKEKLEKSNDSIKQEKTFRKEEHSNIGKSKKNFLTNGSISPQKQDSSFEQNVKSKKKNRKNSSVQNFPRTEKETEANSFNFVNTKSKIKYDDVEQNLPSKNVNSVVQDNVKKSKKLKRESHNAYANNISTLENNTEVNTPAAKGIADFIRKPKNRNENGTLDSANSNNLSNAATSDNLFGKNEEFSMQQEKQIKKFEVTAPDFIKLGNSTGDNKIDAEERLSRTLFVGNMPSGISKSELKHFFARFGPVESVRLPGVETDKAKIFGKNPPKLLHPNYASDSIPAFITFKEKKSAEEALKLSGSIFKGHHITVDFALQPGSHKLYDDKRSIFIGNLPFDVKDESIWNAFNHCGRIEGVRVVRDRQTGLGKGFGYVLFSTVEAKNNALAVEGLKIEGRDIRIKPVDSSKRAQKSDPTPAKRDTFKSHAIRMKKNNKATGGHKSIRKLTKKQKVLHNKKKTAAILQKAMK